MVEPVPVARGPVRDAARPVAVGRRAVGFSDQTVAGRSPSMQSGVCPESAVAKIVRSPRRSGSGPGVFWGASPRAFPWAKNKQRHPPARLLRDGRRDLLQRHPDIHLRHPLGAPGEVTQTQLERLPIIISEKACIVQGTATRFSRHSPGLARSMSAYPGRHAQNAMNGFRHPGAGGHNPFRIGPFLPGFPGVGLRCRPTPGL